jgi:hypothetical protein
MFGVITPSVGSLRPKRFESAFEKYNLILSFAVFAGGRFSLSTLEN